MRYQTFAIGLLLLAPMLSGCGAQQHRVEPELSVRPQICEAPTFALPPADLVKRPEIIDFLSLPPSSTGD